MHTCQHSKCCTESSIYLALTGSLDSKFCLTNGQLSKSIQQQETPRAEF